MTRPAHLDLRWLELLAEHRLQRPDGGLYRLRVAHERRTLELLLEEVGCLRLLGSNAGGLQAS